MCFKAIPMKRRINIMERPTYRRPKTNKEEWKEGHGMVELNFTMELINSLLTPVLICSGWFVWERVE